MNFLCQGIRKLSSDRQTNRQTDRTEIIYYAASRVVNKYCSLDLFHFVDLYTQAIHLQFSMSLFDFHSTGNVHEPVDQNSLIISDSLLLKLQLELFWCNPINKKWVINI